jgi:hypothetical protein
LPWQQIANFLRSSNLSSEKVCISEHSLWFDWFNV